ncbi:CvpA family protein [Candidatus Margulisiibacteriota bacterium]
MTILDIIVVVVIIYNIVMGIKRGLVRILLDVFALGLSLFLAFSYYKDLSVYFSSIVSFSPFTLSVISFCFIWLGFFLVLTIVNAGVDKIIKLSMLGFLNRIGGGALGLAKGVFFLIPLLMILLYFNKPFVERTVLVKPFVPLLKDVAADFVPTIKKIKEEAPKTDLKIKDRDTLKAIGRR